MTPPPYTRWKLESKRKIWNVLRCNPNRERRKEEENNYSKREKLGFATGLLLLTCPKQVSEWWW